MRKSASSTLAAAGTLALILGSLAIAPQAALAEGASVVEEGMAIAFNRKKGNCLN